MDRMDKFVIEGGHRLYGRVRINGSKNAALPMLAVPLLTDDAVTLRDVPNLADIKNMLRLLASLGCMRMNTKTGLEEEFPADSDFVNGVITLQSTDPSKSHATYDIVKTMRASICTLGPMLAKRGYARVSMPGGCAIGDRPVDLHLRGLRALGAEITTDAGDIIARVPAEGLRGTSVFLGGPMGSTVLGTANVMCAATLAKGTTIIECAACEPEIVDLANLLIAMGAKIEGAGSPRVVIHGVENLHGADYTIMPDRIEAGTFMMAAAMTNGDLTLDNCPMDAMLSATYTLGLAGVEIKPVSSLASVVAGNLPAMGSTNGNPHGRVHSNTLTVVSGSSDPYLGSMADEMRRTVRVTCSRKIKPVEVTTQPHPGFPTDLQAQLVALLCLADGNSVVTERIFPDRFMHVPELLRMGAKITKTGSTVVISGVSELTGAQVMASDLRASAGLVLAGLAANGTTTVNRVYHLDRGYERMEDRLKSLGAQIKRISEREGAMAEPVGA